MNVLTFSLRSDAVGTALDSDPRSRGRQATGGSEVAGVAGLGQCVGVRQCTHKSRAQASRSLLGCVWG